MTASVHSPSSSATGVASSERMSIRTACPRRPHREASWSSSPVCAPAQSASTREHRRASATGSSGSAPSASATETHSAADDPRPAPAGRSARISSSAGSGCSSARTPSTYGSQPPAVARTAGSSAGAAVTVIPCSMANGRQSPPL